MTGQIDRQYENDRVRIAIGVGLVVVMVLEVDATSARDLVMVGTRPSLAPRSTGFPTQDRGGPDFCRLPWHMGNVVPKLPRIFDSYPVAQ